MVHHFQNHESIVTYRNKQQNYILSLMIVWVVEIEMLNPIHELEWALSFIILRKLKHPRVSRISSILEQPLRVLNKRVVRKHCSLTTVLQVLAGVQNVTTLDLNMGFEPNN